MSEDERSWGYEFDEIIEQQDLQLPSHADLVNEAKLGAARQLTAEAMHLIVETAPGSYTFSQAWFGALGIIESMVHQEVHDHLDD